MAAEGAAHMRAVEEPPAGGQAEEQASGIKSGWSEKAGIWVQTVAKGLAGAHS